MGSTRGPGAAAVVDVRPVGGRADHRHGRAQPLEDGRPDLDHGAVRAVHGNAEPIQRPPEPVRHELDIALAEPRRFRDRAGRARPVAGVEKRLDRLLLGVLELEPAAEELDPVVLSGVVGGGDDGARLVGKESDRRSRQHAPQRDVRPTLGEPQRQRRFQCRP